MEKAKQKLEEEEELRREEEEERKREEEYFKYHIPGTPKPPKFQPLSYGWYGNVSMTKEQYLDLVSLVGEERLHVYISILDKRMEDGLGRPHGCYKLLRKWIYEDCSLRK